MIPILPLPHLELLTLNFLANALWQLPLIFLTALAAARLAAPAGPRLQHRLWVAALLLSVVLPACTFNLRALLHTRDGVVTTQTTLLSVAPAHTHTQLAASLALAALLAYAATLLYFTARLNLRLVRTRALHRTAQPLTLTGETLLLWQRLTRHFHLHNVHLATSPAIAGPSTIGIRRPIVLLPPAILTSLSHEDLAAALAHECAHIQRRDFAKNLLYELLTLPIAWHPILRLTRHRLAESREMLCDELAAHANHGSTRYAHSLLRLAASCTRTTTAAHAHAIGILDANVLERRIMRLTRTLPTSATSRRLATAGILFLGAATCATAMTLHLEVPAAAVLAAPSSASSAPQTSVAPSVPAGIMAGQVISKVPPTYPQEAKEQGIEGSVVLHAIIGTDGVIKELTPVSGPEQLQASAIEAVKQWVYKPYMLNGQPTEVETTITVNYQLADKHPQPQTSSTANPQPNSESQPAAYKIGGSVLPPVLISSVDPVYPPSARLAKQSGNVVVGLTVDPTGTPQNIHIAHSMGGDFDASAIQAVEQYRFHPATQNGTPVPVNLQIEVNFRYFN